jgi:hypothetical protein
MDLKHESPSAAAMMFRGGGGGSGPMPLTTKSLTEGLLRIHGGAGNGNNEGVVIKTEPRTASPTCGEQPTTSKRARHDDSGAWIPSPGHSSLDPLSPSSTFQNANSSSMGPGGGQGYHSTSAGALSNGYSSPLSSGSYDPYSPNGKIGEYNKPHNHHLENSAKIRFLCNEIKLFAQN